MFTDYAMNGGLVLNNKKAKKLVVALDIMPRVSRKSMLIQYFLKMLDPANHPTEKLIDFLATRDIDVAGRS